MGLGTKLRCLHEWHLLLTAGSPALALDIFHSEDKSQTGLCDAYDSQNLGLVSPGHTSWRWRASSHFPACFHLSSLSSVPEACLGLCHQVPVPLLWSLGYHNEESSKRIRAVPQASESVCFPNTLCQRTLRCRVRMWFEVKVEEKRAPPVTWRTGPSVTHNRIALCSVFQPPF